MPPAPNASFAPISDAALFRLEAAFADPEFFEKLVAHVLARMHKKYWWCSSGQDLAGGDSAEDIAQQAVNDLLEGRRAWDLEKQPDAFTHLCDIADSILNGCVERWENRMIRAVSPLGTTDDDGKPRASVLDAGADEALSPAAALQLQEFAGASIARVDQFLRSLEDDLPCLEVARTLAYSDDDPNRRSAVKALNLSPQAYDNVRKRLARRWTKFMSAPAAMTKK